MVRREVEHALISYRDPQGRIRRTLQGEGVDVHPDHVTAFDEVNGVSEDTPAQTARDAAPPPEACARSDARPGRSAADGRARPREARWRPWRQTRHLLGQGQSLLLYLRQAATVERIVALTRTYSLINPAATQRQIQALTTQLFTMTTSKAGPTTKAQVPKRTFT